MSPIILVFERGRPFNYGAFTKYMINSGNVIWRKSPGVYCERSKFRKAVEIELGVDTETAKEVVETTIELGMIEVDSGDVIVNEKLRR